MASWLAAWCQEEPKPSLAPLNPAFVKYMLDLEAGVVPETVGEGGFGLGAIPSPVDDSHLRCASESEGLPGYFYPPSFDLRNENKVTAVRNQSSCGACWTFAAMASLESFLLPGDLRDFSENNLKDTHGFDWTCCYGGNDDMSTAYFARWDGPANETDDPYVLTCTSPSSWTVQKHVQDINWVPQRTSPTDNDTMKSAIQTNAVSISMRWEGDQNNPTAYWKPSTYAYYYNGSSGTNHLVAVVGWDESFAASNFSTTPPGNGAWLIKNSWGTGWGNSGYFWLSYYDTHGGRSYRSSAFSALTAYTYSAVYQYDPLGRIANFGYGLGNPTWGANMFAATVTEQLSAASTYFNATGTAWELYVYTGCTADQPRSGSLAASKTGVISTPGYHTIPLDAPVALTSGQLFSVVFKLSTPDYGFPLSIEYPIAGYSSAATAIAGQSFYGPDGTTWSDLTSWQANTNACIKAFVATCSPPSAPSIASVEDRDACTLTGIRITFASGSPTTRHDLYKDGALAASSIASPFVYNPGDISSHNYTVRAVNGPDSCRTDSDPVAGMDAVCPPGEAAPGDVWSTAQLWPTKTSQEWPSLDNASAYRLYGGAPADLPNLHTSQTNSCLRWDGVQTNVSGLTETPGAGSFYWYIVVGYNLAGEGPAGAGRLITSSGNCPVAEAGDHRSTRREGGGS
jgi:C1A family cysteine protease